MRHWIGLTMASVAAGLFLASPASATVLTFDIDNMGDGFPVPAAYGDNVTGDGVPLPDYGYDEGNDWTPNIATEYATVLPAQVVSDTFIRWHDDFGPGGYSSFQVAYPATNSQIAEISFVPDPGYAVRINSFDLAAWASAAWNTPVIQIVDATRTQVLWSSPGEFIGPATETFTPNYTGAPGQVLRLQFGYDYDVAFDNVNFDQVIPEPASAALLALAAAPLLRRRGRA